MLLKPPKVAEKTDLCVSIRELDLLPVSKYIPWCFSRTTYCFSLRSCVNKYSFLLNPLWIYNLPVTPSLGNSVDDFDCVMHSNPRFQGVPAPRSSPQALYQTLAAPIVVGSSLLSPVLEGLGESEWRGVRGPTKGDPAVSHTPTGSY